MKIAKFIKPWTCKIAPSLFSINKKSKREWKGLDSDVPNSTNLCLRHHIIKWLTHPRKYIQALLLRKQQVSRIWYRSYFQSSWFNLLNALWKSSNDALKFLLLSLSLSLLVGYTIGINISVILFGKIDWYPAIILTRTRLYPLYSTWC